MVGVTKRIRKMPRKDVEREEGGGGSAQGMREHIHNAVKYRGCGFRVTSHMGEEKGREGNVPEFISRGGTMKDWLSNSGGGGGGQGGRDPSQGKKKTSSCWANGRCDRVKSFTTTKGEQISGELGKDLWK